MDKELALEVWNDLAPIPASLRRLRFNGRTEPVHSVVVGAHEISGKDVDAVLKVADAHKLGTTVRGSGEGVEIVLFREVAAS